MDELEWGEVDEKVRDLLEGTKDHEKKKIAQYFLEVMDNEARKGDKVLSDVVEMIVFRLEDGEW